MSINNLNLGKNSEVLPWNKEILEHLKNIFWEDIKSEIEKNISETSIEWLEKLNKRLWNTFISSCFHPDEFGIWSYRPTSLINLLELSEKLWFKPEVFYLDTINWKALKWFPNLQVWKSKPTIINNISKNSENDINPKEAFLEADRIFNEIIWKSFNKKETLDFFEEIFEELWLEEQVNLFLEKNNIDKKTFKTFILKENSLEILDETKKIFIRKILNEKYKNGISTAEVHAEFQNSILTILFQKYFPEYLKNLEKAWIYDKKWLNLEISYNNPEFVEKYSLWVKDILEDEKLWKDLFFKFFEKLIDESIRKSKEKDNWKIINYLEAYSYWENWREFKIFVEKNLENNNLEIYSKNKKESIEISKETFFENLTKAEWKINFSGAIMIFLWALSWTPHIGSERWIRELVAKSLEEHLKEKWFFDENIKNYIEKVIFWLDIFETFEENKDNTWKRLAWNAWTFPNDMIKMLFIWWDFAKDQLEKAKKQMDKNPEINEELLLQSLKKCVEYTHKKIQNLQDESKKEQILKKFYGFNDKFNSEKNLENLLEFVKFCYDLEKFL